MQAIDASGLEKVYRGRFRRQGQHALRGLSLQIPAGTAFGLIGRNGAGKTTFIKILLSAVLPTRGDVKVLGAPPDDPRTRARIGYLPERLRLPASWTPRQYLASIGRLKRAPMRGPQLDDLLGRVGLAADAGRKIGGFSKGMKQRLGLAAALVGAPDLLVLDEPTDGIDPIGRRQVREILVAERSRGATIFLNSHLLSETERICDRIGILSDGRLVREGALEDLRRTQGGWRARFADGADSKVLADAGFCATETAGIWGIAASDPEALNLALDRARTAGALLVGLERESRELEEILLDALGRAA